MNASRKREQTLVYINNMARPDFLVLFTYSHASTPKFTSANFILNGYVTNRISFITLTSIGIIVAIEVLS
jgi:hypothetical protein